MNELYDLDQALNTDELRAIIADLKEKLDRVRAHEGIPVPSEWQKFQALCDANRRDAERYSDQALHAAEERALLVKQVRKLAQNSLVRPYANQLLCTLGEPCVAEEDVRAKVLERLLEDIARRASQPSRGLI